MFFKKKEKLYHQEKKKLSQTGLNKLSVGLTAEVPSCCFPGVDKCPVLLQPCVSAFRHRLMLVLFKSKVSWFIILLVTVD